MSGSRTAEEALDRKVYLAVRNAILRRQIMPGEKLSIESLSKQLGVSRMPVRLAMQRLASDGFIETEANRAPSVVKPSSKTATEVFFLRTLLEPAAASLAARHATKKALKDLKDLIEIERSMLKARNFIECVEANVQVHSHIAKMSGNKLLSDSIQQMLEKSSIIFFLFDPFYQYSETEILKDYDEGILIMEAIQNRDEELAAQRMKDHIQRAFSARPVESLDENQQILPKLK